MMTASPKLLPTVLPLVRHLAAMGLEATVVQEIAGRFRDRRLRRGEPFVTEGEVADRLGFVVSGCFAMEAIHEDGRLFIKDFMGPSSFLLGGFEPSAESQVTIRAVREAWILEAAYSAILALQQVHPALEVLARRGLERRYEALVRRLEHLAGLNAAQRYEVYRKDFSGLTKEIPLHLVAAYLDITPTQLSRIRRRERDSST